MEERKNQKVHKCFYYWNIAACLYKKTPKTGWKQCLLQTNFSLVETYLPAWIVEAMCKNLRRLAGAVEVWIAPWDGVRDIAQVSIDIEA